MNEPADMKPEKGFSMIEVLVTIVIVSLGLLGIAGIIVNGIKSNQSSYARTQASVLANDIIDRMRANRTTSESPETPYNLTLAAATPDASSSNVAQNDLNQWRTALANTLPSGTGSVNLNAATRHVTVVVQWDNSRVTGGRSDEQISIETRL